jgi:hypothetical protein
MTLSGHVPCTLVVPSQDQFGPDSAMLVNIWLDFACRPYLSGLQGDRSWMKATAQRARREGGLKAWPLTYWQCRSIQIGNTFAFESSSPQSKSVQMYTQPMPGGISARLFSMRYLQLISSCSSRDASGPTMWITAYGEALFEAPVSWSVTDHQISYLMQTHATCDAPSTPLSPSTSSSSARLVRGL